MAKAILSNCQDTMVDGEERGTKYMNGLSEVTSVVDTVTKHEIKSIARSLLGIKGPLSYLSLTALKVDSYSSGMQEHVDYPHFHPSFPKDCSVIAQFVLALDGTTYGRAPTWLYEPSNVIELDVGDMLVFTGDSLHGVKPNSSNFSRTNLLWSIGPSWIRPMQLSLWDFHKIDDESPKELLKKWRNEK